MPRAVITDELAETLRSIRLQNKISTNQLALHIGKSPAYISRIESRGIKTIDTSILYEILKFIINEGDDDKLAEDIYRSLTIKYTSSEIKKQLWYTNFETITCSIPIPSELIDEINKRITISNIDPYSLLNRINSNEDISKDELYDDTIPYNEWYISEYNNTTCIKIRISERLFNSILNKTTKESSYIFLLAITYYLTKIELHGDNPDISPDENSRLMNIATEFLNGYKFYTVSEKHKMLSGMKSQDEYRQILNTFDVENIELVNQLLSGISYASERNISDTNCKLKSICENMEWDLGFMLKVASLSYISLNNISVTDKRKLLTDIEDLITRYSTNNAGKQPIEYY